SAHAPARRGPRRPTHEAGTTPHRPPARPRLNRSVAERRLGRIRIEVSRVILGCGNFGGIGSAPALFGQVESREQAFAIMDAAVELGITTFDTADAYGGGRSETYIGEWLRTKPPGARDRIVLSTKTFNPMHEG